MLQKTPFSFDVSVWEFFWPLMTGRRLVIAQPGRRIATRQLPGRRHPASGDHDAALRAVDAARCSSTSRALEGCAEPAPRHLQRRSARRRARRAAATIGCRATLHNLYGPTEAAIDVTAWSCVRGDSSATIPIGSPIANVRAFVLGRDGLPTPPGGVGELYLTGPNLARGYVNEPDLTAERFLPCAFLDASSGARPGERMYRTGDRVRLRADGAIEFLGRIDAQVKVHGVRIELGDVEAALARHPACAAAAATVQPDAEGRAQLVAFVVSRPGTMWTAGELRAFLREQVPAAMVPSRYVAIDALPRTPSGKLDRRRLPVQGPGETAAATAAQAEALADLLRQVESLTDEDARSLLANAVRE